MESSDEKISQDSTTDTVQVAADAARIAKSTGQALARGRESKGMSRLAVADSLKLTRSAVMALEEGEWSQLGAPVYLRGYLLAFGRLVDVSVGEAMDSLSAVEATREIEAPATPRPYRRRRGWFQSSQRWVSYGVATALVAIPVTLVVIQAFDGSLFDNRGPLAVLTDESENSQVHDEAEPVPPVLASMTGSRSRAAKDDTISGDSGLNAEPAEPLLDVAPLETIAPPPIDVQSEPPVDIAPLPELLLVLDEDVWMDVRRQSGERLEVGLKEAGTEWRFSLNQPLSVRLGNAGAVTATVNGKPFLLEPHMERDIAKFELDIHSG